MSEKVNLTLLLECDYIYGNIIFLYDAEIEKWNSKATTHVAKILLKTL